MYDEADTENNHYNFNTHINRIDVNFLSTFLRMQSGNPSTTVGLHEILVQAVDDDGDETFVYIVIVKYFGVASDVVDKKFAIKNRSSP